MKKGDKQLGFPGILYKETQANIEAIAKPVEGMLAYATDIHVMGTFNGAAWEWESGEGGEAVWGDITGELSAQTDLNGILTGLSGALGGKVDSLENYSLVADAEIDKIHAPGSDDQDLSGLEPKQAGKSLSTNDLTNGLKASYDGAVSHAGSAHAPSNAQANADITKAEIEAKLTGVIASHNHAGGADPFIYKLILTADKPTGANTTPVTTGLAFNFEANSKYVIDIYAMVSPTAATTGCGFHIDVSAAVTYVATHATHQLALSGTLSGNTSVGDAAVTAKGQSSGMPGTAIYPVMGHGILISGANAGTATFYFYSETTAVTTLKAGTMIRVMKMA